MLNKKGLKQEEGRNRPAPQFKSINSPALSFLHSPTLTPIHDHWAGDCSRVTEGQKRPHLGLCPGPNIPLQGRQRSRVCTTRISGSLSCGAREVRSPCAWRGGARPGTLCDPMDCSMPGFPLHHQLLELAQTHVHRIGDAIQPSHPLSPPSPPTSNLSQHQGLFPMLLLLLLSLFSRV